MIHLDSAQYFYDLAELISERFTTKCCVTFVSEKPENFRSEFSNAWRVQFQKYMAERECQSDIGQLKTLTELITTMQQASFGYPGNDDNASFIFAHPDTLDTNSWNNRQILVCDDNSSLKTSVRLLQNINTDFFIIIIKPTLDQEILRILKELNLKSIDRAKTNYRKLILHQLSLAKNFNIEPEKLTRNISDRSSLIGQVSMLDRENPEVEQFLKNQKEISKLRIICGHYKPFPKCSRNRIIGMRTMTKYLLGYDSTFEDQLFDNCFRELGYASHGRATR